MISADLETIFFTTVFYMSHVEKQDEETQTDVNYLEVVIITRQACIICWHMSLL